MSFCAPMASAAASSSASDSPSRPPRSFSWARQRPFASSSRSASLTTSELRVLNRFPSSPRTRPKPTWSTRTDPSAGTHPADRAAWNTWEKWPAWPMSVT